MHDDFEELFRWEIRRALAVAGPLVEHDAVLCVGWTGDDRRRDWLIQPSGIVVVAYDANAAFLIPRSDIARIHDHYLGNDVERPRTVWIEPVAELGSRRWSDVVHGVAGESAASEVDDHCLEVEFSTVDGKTAAQALNALGLPYRLHSC